MSRHFIGALNNIISLLMWWFIMGSFLINISNVESRNDLTTIKEWACNSNLLNPNDPFLDDVYDMLGEMIDETPAQPNMAYMTENSGHGITAYGYANCSTMNIDDCSSCLGACMATFDELCGPALGAWIAMTGCYMRYEDYEFVPDDLMEYS